MDQVLNKIFRYIPEWLFVLIILGGGVTFFFFDKPLISVCDAQIQDFSNGQVGKLFPRAVRVLNPLTGGVYFDDNLLRSKNHCIDSPKGTGCYQYFKIIQGVLYDFKKLENKCLKKLSESASISRLFEDYLMAMTLMAWGEYPPRSQAQKTGWLAEPDVKTFCTVKNYYEEFYPPESLNKLIAKTLNQLVVDPRVVFKAPAVEKSKKELFVEELKKNKDEDEDDPYVFEKAKMEIKKAYDLSLFSTDCMFYL